MTPHMKETLKSMGVSGREFATLTGLSEDTVSGWGRRRHGREVQHEPLWAWLLIDAWRHSPAALECARESMAEAAKAAE